MLYPPVWKRNRKLADPRVGIIGKTLNCVKDINCVKGYEITFSLHLKIVFNKNLDDLLR
jgi:hypothetical protein